MEYLIGKVILNDNGENYKVLDHKKDYTLLETVDRKEKEYIVAWCLQKYNDKYVWEQGHYFSSKKRAKKWFRSRNLERKYYRVGITIPTFCDQQYLRARDEEIYAKTGYEAIEVYKTLYTDWLNEDEKKALKQGKIKIGVIKGE